MKRTTFNARYLILPLLLASVYPIAGCNDLNDDPDFFAQVVDTTAPQVTYTAPARDAVNVALNRKIIASFGEAMDPATILAANLTVSGPDGNIQGVVAYAEAGSAASFTPASNLATHSTYTVSLQGLTGFKDLAGNALARDYSWRFTSGVNVDNTAPAVSFTTPLDGEQNVATNRKIIVTFTEDIDPATVVAANMSVVGPSGSVTGTVAYAAGSHSITFTPFNALDIDASYVVTLHGMTGVKDLAGNALAAAYGWSFATAAGPDTKAPVVSFIAPESGETNVTLQRKLVVRFSELMDPLTIQTANVTLVAGSTAVNGTVAYDMPNNLATFTPVGPLAVDTIHTATISTGVKDLAGNAMASPYIWTFTTVLTSNPAPVLLGSAGNFAILSKAGISTIPTSVITGDIGVSPMDAAGITGFSLTMGAMSGAYSTSTQVIGKVYAADYAVPTPSNLTTAIGAMETAYIDAAGRVGTDFTELGAGDISGLTLVRGLYKWGTGVTINSDVTLNGGADDVWIFQIDGGLTQAAATRVTLTGGAQAKNVFWQVFGSVALNTTAHLEGIVLSKTEITLATGATVLGRLYAQTAVTLDAATVTQPD